MGGGFHQHVVFDLSSINFSYRGVEFTNTLIVNTSKVLLVNKNWMAKTKIKTITKFQIVLFYSKSLNALINLYKNRFWHLKIISQIFEKLHQIVLIQISCGGFHLQFFFSNWPCHQTWLIRFNFRTWIGQKNSYNYIKTFKRKN